MEPHRSQKWAGKEEALAQLKQGLLGARHHAGSWASLHKALRKGLVKLMKSLRAREVKRWLWAAE